MNPFYPYTQTHQHIDNGPLGPIIDAYAALLHQRGYKRQSARIQIRLIADFSRWMGRQGLQACRVSHPIIDRYLRSRDHVLLRLAIQTGLRLSEIISLRYTDVQLGQAAHVRCHGKGRKERCTPLTKPTATALQSWLHEEAGPLRTSSFQTHAAVLSAPMGSSTCWPIMWLSPNNPVRH